MTEEAVPQGYKQTEVGVIPEDWDVTTLGRVCVTSSGTTPSRSMRDRYYSNGTIHWVKTMDLNNSYIEATDERITPVALSETSLRTYPVGTILVAMYGGFNQIGRTGLLKIPAAVNQAITAIQPNNDELDTAYLLAVLNFNVEYWKGVASSSRKDPNITSADIRAFQVAYPMVAEQRTIAAALSDVDHLISSLNRLISKKRAVKIAAIHQLLTGNQRLPGFSGKWKTKQLGDVFTLLGTASNARSDLTQSGDIGYIHYGDIHGTSSSFLDCDTDEIPYIASHLVKNVPSVEEGDLVMVDASEDYDGIGKSIEVKNVRGRRIVAGLHTLLLRGNKLILADGFKGYLQYIPALRSALIRLATGISVYGISKNKVRSIEISLPAIEEQTAIATVLSDMDAEIEALEARREKTRKIKQGMMQELLTGRTRLV